MGIPFKRAFENFDVMSNKILAFITIGLLIVAIVLLMLGFFMDSIMLYVFGGLTGLACLGLGVYTGYKAMTVNIVADELTPANKIE